MWSAGMDSFIIAALAVCSLTAPAYGEKGTSKARSCSDIKVFYKGKGFLVEDVPQFEISGEHLRICPQGYTCCTSNVEDKLASQSRTEVENVIKDAGRSLQISLTGQYKIFDGHFLDLLNRSELNLQETFTSTWGSLYNKNSDVFSELYTELKKYYRGANINLEETLNDFWIRLLEKLFFQANGQYVIGEDYLECVSKQIDTLRPFGDTPRQMKMKVTRTLVAARSFVQGLVTAGEAVRRVSQVPMSQECMRAIMKMTYCPHCRGMPSARPCLNYCTNVMKGCLANQADLDTEWRHLADTMIQVADRLDDPAGVESVILSLPSYISEAMNTMMENIASINSKVRTHTGTRIQVSDVRIILGDNRPYWTSLPNLICSDRVATGLGSEDKCWNGNNRARYLPELMNDGLASQINNPEVEIDITKPDMTIRQQIMQLKIMTHRLKNALNGQDVEFQDTSDDASGSGSGCADDMCSRDTRLVLPITDRPVAIPYPPENERVKGSAMQNLPSISIYLLTLLILLLRR
uniref:Glypican-1 n=1 Tax=Astatotilapia calliptera TaxID=8154 RepID=A0AAX7TD63_ASTCA